MKALRIVRRSGCQRGHLNPCRPVGDPGNSQKAKVFTRYRKRRVRFGICLQHSEKGRERIGRKPRGAGKIDNVRFHSSDLLCGPELLPGSEILAAALRSRKYHGRCEAGRKESGLQVFFQVSGQQVRPLPQPGETVAGGQHEDLVEDIAPHIGQELIGGAGVAADRVHGLQTHVENRFREEHHHNGNGRRGPQSLFPGRGQGVRHLLQRQRARPSRRHVRKNFRENGVDEDKGDGDPEHRELPQLDEDRKPAEAKRPEGADAGEHGQQPDVPDFPRGLLSARGMRPIQEKKIGDALIDRDRNDRPPETQNHDRYRFMEKRKDKKGEHGAGHGRQQGKQSEDRSREGEEQQHRDADGGQGDGDGDVSSDNQLVVEGRPVGPDRGQDHLPIRPAELALEFGRHRVQQFCGRAREDRVRSGRVRGRGQQQMSAVGGEKVPLLNAGTGRRGQLREPGQDQGP